MNKPSIIFCSGLILLTTCFGCSEKVIATDFETVCGYFQALEQLDGVNATTPAQRHDFIMNKIEAGLPTTSNARAAWEGIVNAVPEQRYELFKSAAESVYPLPFDCEPMKKLAPVSGD